MMKTLRETKTGKEIKVRFSSLANQLLSFFFTVQSSVVNIYIIT